MGCEGGPVVVPVLAMPELGCSSSSPEIPSLPSIHLGARLVPGPLCPFCLGWQMGSKLPPSLPSGDLPELESRRVACCLAKECLLGIAPSSYVARSSDKLWILGDWASPGLSSLCSPGSMNWLLGLISQGRGCPALMVVRGSGGSPLPSELPPLVCLLSFPKVWVGRLRAASTCLF
jgi:hypothetical protein